MRVCVFCGSQDGKRPAYLAAAAELAGALAARGIGIVYGGASVGTMGRLADAGLEAGAEVIGVIPRSLQDRELAHPGLSSIHVVDTLLERKKLMAELSDAFISLPGGLGTLDELFEVLTWAVLGYHDKPMGLLNLDGYYDHLLGFLQHGVDQGFVRTGDRDRLIVAGAVPELLDQVLEAEPS
jgi:uncharacterized protein (TIGR00730 family)